MEQRISVITLGVADLKRSKQFYERLGWRRSLAKAEGIVFFQAGGMGLALYPREFLTSRRILRVNARRNGPTGSRQQFRIPAFLPVLASFGTCRLPQHWSFPRSLSPAFAEDKLRGNDCEPQRPCLANDASAFLPFR